MKNKIKKKFNSRKSVIDARKREIPTFGGNPIPHQDYSLMLEDLLSMTIRYHSSPYLMIRIQGIMLNDLINEEENVSIYKKKLEELIQQKEPEEDIRYVEQELFKHRRLRYALRDIGDGIAWRFLDYDRPVLTQIAHYPRKPHINKEGTVAELYELAETVNKTNHVAILNDLTHFLKKGDITSLLPDGTYEFIEVKSSNSNNVRMIKQKKSLEETLSFLNNKEKMENNEVIKITKLPVEPKSYMKTFENFLIRAEKEVMVVDVIGSHLLVHVTNFTALVNVEISENEFYDKIDKARSKWDKQNDFVMNFVSTDRYSHVQNFAPYSIFPIQYRHRVDLMIGRTLVHTHLNVSEVLRYLNSKGWNILSTLKDIIKDLPEGELPSIDTPVAIIKKKNLTIHVSPQIIARLASEFLSVKSLAEMFEEILSKGKNSANLVFMDFDKESILWD